MRTAITAVIAASVAATGIHATASSDAQHATASPHTEAGKLPIEKMTPKQRVDAFESWLQNAAPENAQQELQAKAAEHLRGIDYSKLSAEQIGTLLMLIVSTEDQADAALPRLDELRTEASPDGLIATAMHSVLSAFKNQQPLDEQAVLAILDHESLPETIRSGKFFVPVLAISYSQPQALQAHTDKIIAIADHLPERPLDADLASVLGRYWMVASGIVQDADALEPVRVKTAKALRNLKTEGEPADTVSAIKEQIAQIDGAFARGELLDHQAPDVDFLWISGEDGPRSLDQLKGKVVVIDFWATWCGPCIRSFPQVADLVEHYKGYDVEIIGVTAPQGRHHDAEGGVTMTGPDRQQEFALMQQFIEAKDITWPIAFSERAAWSEFGIRGIPHVAIIDTKGVVRFREIHPASPKQEKLAMINQLLTEAGLDTPDS